jgi:hypothetical protein
MAMGTLESWNKLRTMMQSYCGISNLSHSIDAGYLGCWLTPTQACDRICNTFVRFQQARVWISMAALSAVAESKTAAALSHTVILP